MPDCRRFPSRDFAQRDCRDSITNTVRSLRSEIAPRDRVIADTHGNPLALLRLAIGAGAAGPAEKAGLAEFGARVRFQHPLVRSAAYVCTALAGVFRVRRRADYPVGPGVPLKAWTC
jgi:hypothetical protein